jgi:hypothetical protein
VSDHFAATRALFQRASSFVRAALERPTALRAALERPTISMLLQVGLIVLAHRVFWRAAHDYAILPVERYAEPELIGASLRSSPFAMLLVIITGPLLLRYRRLGWNELDPSKLTRWFMMVPVITLVWLATTYNVNLFHDHAYLSARLLLVVLAVASLLHPLFVAPLSLWVMVVLGQLDGPTAWANWHWADKRLPLDTLFLFTAFLHVRAWSRPHPQLFAFLVLVLTGASYAHAAYGKLSLGPDWSYWPLNAHFGNLSIGAYLNAKWLGHWTEPEILRLASFLNTVSVPLGVGTILLEAGAVALVWHRRITIPWLLALVSMHLAILLSSGIFFWKWGLQNLALCGYVWLLRKQAGGDSGARQHRALPLIPSRAAIPMALAVILSAGETFSPLRFAWFDSPFTNYFEVRAQGQSGRSYTLDPRFFAPYDLLMVQSRFYYAVEQPILAGTFATVQSHALLEKLQAAKLDDLPAIRKRHGRQLTDRWLSVTFLRFLQRSVFNAQRRGSRRYPLDWAAAPFHFRASPSKDAYGFEEPVVELVVRFHEWFYDGHALHHVTDQPLFKIPIPPADGSEPGTPPRAPFPAFTTIPPR